MSKQRYLFQKRKVSFANRLFEKGLNAAAFVLFSLKENGQLFLNDLPSCYPGFKILKDTFGVSPGKKRFTKAEISTNLDRLEKQGLVRKEQKRKVCILTEKGKELVSYIEDRYSLLNEKWDKKLRIVIFDIPEKKRHYRVWLRQELILLDFKELQKSVYLGKFPLPKTLYQEVLKFGLNDFIFVFTAGAIDKKQKILEFLGE